MQVTVRFFGLFKRYTGNAQRVYDLPEGSCAGDLLRLIGEDYGPRLPADLWDAESGRFHRSVRIIRRGGTYLGETETLYDGNELLLLYAMAGG
jgi:molybdopterin converting factor small subunit